MRLAWTEICDVVNSAAARRWVILVNLATTHSSCRPAWSRRAECLPEASARGLPRWRLPRTPALEKPLWRRCRERLVQRCRRTPTSAEAETPQTGRPAATTRCRSPGPTRAPHRTGKQDCADSRGLAWWSTTWLRAHRRVLVYVHIDGITASFIRPARPSLVPQREGCGLRCGTADAGLGVSEYVVLLGVMRTW